VLPPAARTASGRRLYDAARVARLELVATLRELGLGLADVRRVLAGQASIAEVAAVHLDALDAQIRALRLHRAVLAVVVKRAAGNEEMTLMNKLARMSVAERRQMIEDFLAEVFQGLEPDPAGAPRWAPAPNLPDGPSPEQADDGLLDWGAGRRRTPRRQCCGGARVPAGFRRGRPGSEPDPGARRGEPAPRRAARRAGGVHRSADRAVLAAHGHHQRMAAVPVPHAGLDTLAADPAQFRPRPELSIAAYRAWPGKAPTRK
jgi:DNA-binding transcriptional MerR regulator